MRQSQQGHRGWGGNKTLEYHFFSISKNFYRTGQFHQVIEGALHVRKQLNLKPT